jgi:hypothetical protein
MYIIPTPLPEGGWKNNTCLFGIQIARGNLLSIDNSQRELFFRRKNWPHLWFHTKYNYFV